MCTIELAQERNCVKKTIENKKLQLHHACVCVCERERERERERVRECVREAETCARLPPRPKTKVTTWLASGKTCPAQLF